MFVIFLICDILKEDVFIVVDNFDMGVGCLDFFCVIMVELIYSDLSLVDGNCYLNCEMFIIVINISDEEVIVDVIVMFNDLVIFVIVIF